MNKKCGCVCDDALLIFGALKFSIVYLVKWPVLGLQLAPAQRSFLKFSQNFSVVSAYRTVLYNRRLRVFFSESLFSDYLKKFLAQKHFLWDISFSLLQIHNQDQNVLKLSFKIESSKIAIVYPNSEYKLKF